MAPKSSAVLGANLMSPPLVQAFDENARRPISDRNLNALPYICLHCAHWHTDGARAAWSGPATILSALMVASSSDAWCLRRSIMHAGLLLSHSDGKCGLCATQNWKKTKTTKCQEGKSARHKHQKLIWDITEPLKARSLPDSQGPCCSRQGWKKTYCTWAPVAHVAAVGLPACDFGAV